MDVRVLTSDDAESFRAVRLTALQEAPEAFASSYEEEVDNTIEQVKQHLQPSALPAAFVLGAFSLNNIPIGTLGFMRQSLRKRQHISLIWGMYVLPEFRNQGIGKLLLDCAITKARRMSGLEQIQLTVVQSNEPARRLYISHGFEQFGEEKRALKIGTKYVDEIHMVLHL